MMIDREIDPPRDFAFLPEQLPSARTEAQPSAVDRRKGTSCWVGCHGFHHRRNNVSAACPHVLHFLLFRSARSSPRPAAIPPPPACARALGAARGRERRPPREPRCPVSRAGVSRSRFPPPPPGWGGKSPRPKASEEARKQSRKAFPSPDARVPGKAAWTIRPSILSSFPSRRRRVRGARCGRLFTLTLTPTPSSRLAEADDGDARGVDARWFPLEH